MSTRREQILAAVVTALNGAGKPGGVPTAARTRTADLTPANLPASTVYPVKEEAEKANSVALNRHLLVRIEHVGLASTGVTSDQAVDPLCSWAGKALGGSRLGGLALDCIEHETTFVYEQTPSGAACRASQDFRIKYATAVNNPDSLT